MKKVGINDLVQGLCSISDEGFSCEGVYDFLSSNPVEVDSIQRYLFWNPEFYTRNLIHKDPRFEIMAICWEAGQVSRIHDHSGQKCWMTVPIGKLKGQNFAVAELDESRSFCRLVETDAFDLSDGVAAKVELEEPVHQIINAPEFGGRAVSLHIYSKPYDRCRSYCRDTDTFKEVPLFYTSIDGTVCDSVKH